MQHEDGVNQKPGTDDQRERIADAATEPATAAGGPAPCTRPGAMGVGGAVSAGARAARLAARSGDRAALMDYLRLRRRGAD